MKTTVYSTAKVFKGLINYYAMSNKLDFNIFSLMCDLWGDDKFAPTIPEFSDGVDELCSRGILTVTNEGYMLTSKLRRFSIADLITAACIYEDIAVMSDGYVGTEIFFDGREDMNEYAVRQGSKFGDVDIYDAREFLLLTGLARISADGMYITIM